MSKYGLQVRKTEAQRAEVTLREMNKLIREVDSWLSNIKKKLQLANNDEEQLQVIFSLIRALTL